MKTNKFDARYRKAVIAVAETMGCSHSSTPQQIANGTIAIHDPQTDTFYTLHESGYIRRSPWFTVQFSQACERRQYPLNRRIHYLNCVSRKPISYRLAGPDEQLSLLVRGIINYRNTYALA